MIDNEKIEHLNKYQNKGTTVLAIYRKLDKKTEKITIGDVVDIINSQQAEIEQWKEEANRYQTLWCEDVQTARAEAIKEFAERFKNSLKGYGGLYCRTTMNVRIDNLVKEMVGEDK